MLLQWDWQMAWGRVGLMEKKVVCLVEKKVEKWGSEMVDSSGQNLELWMG
jgi:hypothetical protein